VRARQAHGLKSGPYGLWVSPQARFLLSCPQHEEPPGFPRVQGLGRLRPHTLGRRLVPPVRERHSSSLRRLSLPGRRGTTRRGVLGDARGEEQPRLWKSRGTAFLPVRRSGAAVFPWAALTGYGLYGQSRGPLVWRPRALDGACILRPRYGSSRLWAFRRRQLLQLRHTRSRSRRVRHRHTQPEVLAEPWHSPRFLVLPARGQDRPGFHLRCVLAEAALLSR
jgi:hypothetical protein